MKDNTVIEKIDEEIKSNKKLPKEILDKINKRVFQNIALAVIIMLYFCFIILGFNNIERQTFITDLKVFSVAILGIVILLFENGYKKDSGIIAIFGIETLFLDIITLLSVYVCVLRTEIFVFFIAITSYIFSIYYVGKSIVIYNKLRREYLKNLSDINEIVKETPVKKKETSKKNKAMENEKATEQTKENKKNKRSTNKKIKDEKEKVDVGKNEEKEKMKTNTTKSNTTPKKRGRPKKTIDENNVADKKIVEDKQVEKKDKDTKTKKTVENESKKKNNKSTKSVKDEGKKKSTKTVKTTTASKKKVEIKETVEK